MFIRIWAWTRTRTWG